MSKIIPDIITNPDVLRGWWAGARYHPDFYCVLTQSGFRSGSHIDEKRPEHYLLPDANDKELGEAALGALAVSRWLLSKPAPGDVYHPDIEFDGETSNPINGQKREQEWGQRMRKRFKLPSKRDVYVPLKRCDIAKKNGDIVISCRAHVPSKNYGDCWGFATPEMSPYVIMPDTASAEEIGAGLRLAFSRCIDLPE